MENATRLTNLEVQGDLEVLGDLEVQGDLEVKGKIIGSGMTETDYKVTSADAVAAAGTEPTKAEFDAVVTLVNEIKADYNKFLKKMVTGSDT